MSARHNRLHSDLVRQRIQTSQLINRLTDHAFGKVKMSATQVGAALGLLRKSLPDLSAVTHSGSVELTRPEELSDDELADIVRRGGEGTLETPASETESGEVH